MKQNIEVSLEVCDAQRICNSSGHIIHSKESCKEIQKIQLQKIGSMNVLKMFRYIKYIKNYRIGLQKRIDLKKKKFFFFFFVDTDYAGDQSTRKSTSGFLIIFQEILHKQSWYSKLQHTVFLFLLRLRKQNTIV